MNLDEETSMDCQSARTVLDVRTLEPAVQTHLDACANCAAERRVALALRSALVVEAPPELSARLLALAAPRPEPARLDAALQRALVVKTPPELNRRLEALARGGTPPAAPRRPWVMPVYAATALLLGVLLVIAGQIYGLALQELGIGELWRAVAQLPGEWLDQLYTFFPQGRDVVDAFFSLQRALQWVLVGLLIWAVLEMRTSQRALTTTGSS